MNPQGPRSSGSLFLSSLQISFLKLLCKIKIQFHSKLQIKVAMANRGKSAEQTKTFLKTILLHPLSNLTFINPASLVAHLVKNPPAMQETWVQSLGWEDPLEEGMGAHSSTLA